MQLIFLHIRYDALKYCCLGRRAGSVTAPLQERAGRECIKVIHCLFVLTCPLLWWLSSRLVHQCTYHKSKSKSRKEQGSEIRDMGVNQRQVG